MLKIYTVCGAGVGSSMMLRVFIQEILTREGIEAKVEATDIGSINPSEVDIIVTTTDFANVLRNVDKSKIIKIDNLLDKNLLRKELIDMIGSKK